jgi:acetyl-CoA synthetase
VINVSGHRLGTAEIESALVSHPACAEAAVIAIPHDIKGQAVWCYCILRHGFSESSNLVAELKVQVRKSIGAFATPDAVLLVPGLPKTRSGKIMRRLLRKIATGESSAEQLGDISTLAEPTIVPLLIEAVNRLNNHK